MTEEKVKEVFFKNYTGDNLNEALAASIEEIGLALLKDNSEYSESHLKILGTIAMGRSRFSLFAHMMNDDGEILKVVVSPNYLTYFDELRKAMTEASRYMRDNLEIADPWFRERITKEDMEIICAKMGSAIERSAKKQENTREFNSDELKLYGEFFTSALIGILGLDKFQRYAGEINKCNVVLRQCQVIGKLVNNKFGATVS